MKKEFKNIVLTDFNETRWINSDIEAIARLINKMEGQTLLSEKGHPDFSMNQIINQSNVICELSNIKLNGRVVTGDIKYNNNKSNISILENINEYRYSVRAICSGTQSLGYHFMKIITWDVVKK